MESAEVILNLKREIESGKHWYIALLEAMSLWNEAEETLDGAVYRYVIEGEALDWQLLAERLCESVNGLVSEEEKEDLLFKNRPPLDLSAVELRQLIGAEKFRQQLNYYYGVVVEEALIQAVLEEVRKERWSYGLTGDQDYSDEIYRRIYEDTRTELLKAFRRDKGYPQLKSITIGELKEFTYWLFKYRLKRSEGCRVASDTKKALEWLSRQREIKKTLHAR